MRHRRIRIPKFVVPGLYKRTAENERPDVPEWISALDSRFTPWFMDACGNIINSVGRAR